MDPRPLNVTTRRAFLLGVSSLIVAACTDAESADPADSDSAAGSTAPTTSVDTATSAADADSSSDDRDGSSGSDSEPAIEQLTPAMFDALATCGLTAAAGAGPFPTQSPLDRRDIHEGYPGHPLRLGIRVVDQDCQPVPGAMVEIWHTDATGDYSEYEDGGDGKDEGEGTSFCRGIQTADADGILEFQTIYPGWYPGRAVHIHTTVYADSAPTLTGQLYLDEAVTDAVFATGEYAQFGPADTTWADDGIIGDPAADASIIALRNAITTLGEGSLGLVNIGIQV